jgi:hypothetical protein
LRFILGILLQVGPSPKNSKQDTRSICSFPWTGCFDTFIGIMDPGTAMQKYRHLYFFGNLNQYSSEERSSLKYFIAKGLSEIDSQGAYVLQEWIRP